MRSISAISWREQATFDELIKMFILHQINTLNWILQYQLTENTVPVNMSLYSNTIVIPRPQIFPVSLQYYVLRGEIASNNFKIFGLIRPVLEPTIDSTRGKHTNYYTTSVLEWKRKYMYTLICLVRVMVVNATFNNISVISWLSVILVEKTAIPGENHRPVASH